MLIKAFFQNKNSLKYVSLKQQIILSNHINSANQQLKLNSWFNKQSRFFSSKQKIISQFQKIQQQLSTVKASQLLNPVEKQQNGKNQYQQKQQRIVKDFLQLSQQSFLQHMQVELQAKHTTDPHMLLMILSSLQDPLTIKPLLKHLYQFIPILSKSQLLLFYELLLAHRPKSIPEIPSPTNLQEIQTILLILSQIYKDDQKLIQWLKQIPIYKGNNTYMIAVGFFAILQKMQQKVKYKNSNLIRKCIKRIIDIYIDQKDQNKISLAILAFQSPLTCQFGQQILIDSGKIDYQEVDVIKLQLLYIYLQKHFTVTYGQLSKHLKKQQKFQIQQQDMQGQISQTIEAGGYSQRNFTQLSYQQMQQVQKFAFIQHQLKQLIIKIMDINWSQSISIPILLEYWQLFPSCPKRYPWDTFVHKLVKFTTENQTAKKMVDLEPEDIISLLQVMEKMKINKSQLLIRGLALISDKLDLLQTQQLIRLSRICVTYVRQCEDFLISVRNRIQDRRLLLKDQQIKQLNQIFKRVLVLFPRPIVK